MIKELVNDADFDAAVASGNVLVDFNATWCGPCRMMGQIFKAIEGDYPEVTFLSVDVDKHPELAKKFNVHSIPAMFFYKDGKKVQVVLEEGNEDFLLGSRPEDEFTEILDKTFSLKK